MMVGPTTDQPHNGPLRKHTRMTSAGVDGDTYETDRAKAGCMILDMTELRNLGDVIGGRSAIREWVAMTNERCIGPLGQEILHLVRIFIHLADRLGGENVTGFSLYFYRLKRESARAGERKDFPAPF